MGRDMPDPDRTADDRLNRATGGAGATRHGMCDRAYRDRMDRLGMLAGAAPDTDDSAEGDA